MGSGSAGGGTVGDQGGDAAPGSRRTTPARRRFPQVAGGRPPQARRRFTSPAVERTIERVRGELADPKLARLFENCFPNTLDTTVDVGEMDGRPDTFVITGDIEAMWLRDSTAQVWPYLPLMEDDPGLRRLVAGVVHRQSRCILVDPYANAFNKEPADSPWKDDLTEMKPELHERKWEVDSLCYPIRLAHRYWRLTGDTSPFDEAWREAMRSVLATFREQQRKDGPGPYRFQRVTGWQSDTVAGGGYGNPIRPVGLIVSIFRPSDDATIFPFLVPSNHFAVVSLRQLEEMAGALGPGADFAASCRALADEVEAALRRYAVVQHPELGRVWAYEVDGFGNRLHMDDANVPSLLSLPYLGVCAADDPLYLRTRAFVLSEQDPWFFRGTAARGVGGPHTGRDRIWPLGLIMQGLTSTSDAEIGGVLGMLASTDAGTGFMHESFHKDDPSDFTRPWFAWANTLFGELVLKVLQERPGLVRG
ncbi:MAG TPA: glycoside hydrolase family 125 protein [Longimicrobiales bacterium]|nr:glycoside hydrolase family 125 protein [Longimicrobiales bacterium]